LEGTAQALLFKTSSEGCDADTRLAATGWDLGDLARRYRRFLDIFTPVAEAVIASAPPRLDMEAAFVIRTLLIHEYRKIHLQDPLLPPALLPVDWIGTAAYELSKRLYSAVFRAAERYISNTASTLDEPLPTADSSAYGRFGGVDAAADPPA
jgi:phenylacetic acid degradation operon negative regulatory protein